MKILLLGAQGMLGHVVKTYFEEHQYDVICTNRNDKNSDLYWDAVENLKDIEKIIEKYKPEVVINCTGILNKVAEDNKSLAVLMNSYLPHYLDELSAKYNYKFVHVSTDCVFSGKDGNYTETSFRDADNFYGQSKALGEVINERSVTLRTSIVGPDINPNGIGLFQWFMNQTGSVGGYTKVLWTGITTIEYAKAMEVAIKNNLVGLHHVVNNTVIPKKDLLELFKKYFEKDIKVEPNDTVESKKTIFRTNVSYDFDVPSYDTMIADMRDWVISHKEMYPDLVKDMKI